MKREALRHPKMLDLAGRLRLPREHTIGIMDVLIDWVHDMAPRGDIGKWPNGTIAVAAGWSGDPTEFINALVESRWLDRSTRHRLLVHDYPDHAERFVKAKLAKARQWFCHEYYRNGRKWDAPNDIQPPEDELSILTCDPPEVTTALPTVPTIEPTVPRDQTNPNQSKPNHPQTPAKVPQPAAGLAGGWDVDSVAKARLALRSVGFARYEALLSELQATDRTPLDVVEAVATYRANVKQFKGSGAIAEFLRTGTWPADGVITVERAAARNGQREQKARGAEAREIIKAGRKRKQSEEDIRNALTAAGLKWPE